MYKVFVIDDEQDVRRHVIKNIEETGLPFEVVAQFDNGMDAKETILSDPPDLIVTDIRIPYIDGIALAKEIRLAALPTKVIIITGYDLFDYAKNALEYGVTSFIMKPVSPDELYDALHKIQNILDEEFSKSATMARLQKFRAQSIDIIRENDLSKLMQLSEPDERYLQKLEQEGVVLDKPFTTVGVVDYDESQGEFSFDSFETTLYSLKNYLESLKYCHFSYYVFPKNDKLVLLLQSESALQRGEFDRLFTPMLLHFKKTFGNSFTMGISPLCQKTGNYASLYKKAGKALDYRSIIGGDQLIFFDDIENDEFLFLSFDESDYKQLTASLSYSSYEEVDRILNDLFTRAGQKEYFTSYHYIMLNMFNAIIKACASLNLLSVNYLSQSELFNQFLTLKTNEENLEFIRKLAAEVYRVNQQVKSNSSQKNYHTIVRFLEENYADPTLSMDSLAEKVGLSISYISILLKKQNTSFVKYLTTLRIEKAKLLLQDNDNRIVEIAEAVGYSDPYYFSHCFKKATGVSPREFRQNEA